MSSSLIGDSVNRLLLVGSSKEGELYKQSSAGSYRYGLPRSNLVVDLQAKTGGRGEVLPPRPLVCVLATFIVVLCVLRRAVILSPISARQLVAPVVGILEYVPGHLSASHPKR
jgi:hypothetical protein